MARQSPPVKKIRSWCWVCLVLLSVWLFAKIALSTPLGAKFAYNQFVLCGVIKFRRSLYMQHSVSAMQLGWGGSFFKTKERSLAPRRRQRLNGIWNNIRRRYFKVDYLFTGTLTCNNVRELTRLHEGYRLSCFLCSSSRFFILSTDMKRRAAAGGVWDFF